jgi:hypothetical protein
MRHARLFSILVFAAVLGYGAVAFYFLPLATFHGELTRMALLPEKLFGWTKPQPALDEKWMQQASMREADVLVIGDSFSLSGVWQTELTRRGLKVRTESWESIRSVCADFVPWLKAQGFAGKYLVIESIERSLAGRLSSSVSCQHMQYHPNVATDMRRYPPEVSVDTQVRDYSGRFSIGIQTELNTMKYERLRVADDFRRWELPNDVTMAHIPNGCELFSHVRCNDALFLSYDKPEDIGDDALDNMALLNERLGGFTPIWAFVPNKSTVYLYPDKQFWNKAERRFHAPNLLRTTLLAIQAKTVDLYPANNTHLSTSGYLLVGEEIYKQMQLLHP